MTGAVIQYGRGSIDEKHFRSYLDGSAPRKPFLAPAKGLYLSNVVYPYNI